MSPECWDRLETEVMMSQRNRWRKTHQPALPKKFPSVISRVFNWVHRHQSTLRIICYKKFWEKILIPMFQSHMWSITYSFSFGLLLLQLPLNSVEEPQFVW